MHEVVQADALRTRGGVAFMLDQPQHRAEDPRPDPVGHERPGGDREGAARRLEALAAAQRQGDVLGANAVLMDAYDTDVRPMLAELRVGTSLDPDPMAAYARSGYAERIAAERVGGLQAGWGA